MQDYASALNNSARCINEAIRAVTGKIQAAKSGSNPLGLGLAQLNWYPGNRPTPPKYPCVSGYFLLEGEFDSSRRMLYSDMQLDVFVNESNLALCRRICGRLFTGIELDPNKQALQAAIAQFDYERNPTNPPSLEDIQVVIQSTWEDGPEEDPAVVHRLCGLRFFYR